MSSSDALVFDNRSDGMGAAQQVKENKEERTDPYVVATVAVLAAILLIFLLVILKRSFRCQQGKPFLLLGTDALCILKFF